MLTKKIISHSSPSVNTIFADLAILLCNFPPSKGRPPPRDFIATFVGCALLNGKYPVAFSRLSLSYCPAKLYALSHLLTPPFACALCAISFGFRHCPAFSRDSRFIHGRLHNRTSFRFPAHKKRSPHGAAFSFILLICRAKICRSFPSAAPAPSGPRASAPDQPKSHPRGASPSYSARSPGCRARYSSCVL